MGVVTQKTETERIKHPNNKYAGMTFQNIADRMAMLLKYVEKNDLRREHIVNCVLDLDVWMDNLDSCYLKSKCKPQS